jgi:hypothetical protein
VERSAEFCGNSPDEAVAALLGHAPRSAPGHSNWLDPDLVRSKLLAIGGILRHHDDIYFLNGLCEASDGMVVARERDVLAILHEPWQPYDRSKVKATFLRFCRSPSGCA